MHAETSLSIAEHAVRCAIDVIKQRMKLFQIYGRNYVNYSPKKIKIILMQLSNQLDLIYETDNVNTQVQILNYFTGS